MCVFLLFADRTSKNQFSIRPQEFYFKDKSNLELTDSWFLQFLSDIFFFCKRKILLKYKKFLTDSLKNRILSALKWEKVCPPRNIGGQIFHIRGFYQTNSRKVFVTKQKWADRIVKSQFLSDKNKLRSIISAPSLTSP